MRPEECNGCGIARDAHQPPLIGSSRPLPGIGRYATHPLRVAMEPYPCSPAQMTTAAMGAAVHRRPEGAMPSSVSSRVSGPVHAYSASPSAAVDEASSSISDGAVAQANGAHPTDAQEERLRTVSGHPRMPELAAFLAKAFGARWEFTGQLAVKLHADGLDGLRGDVAPGPGISNEPAKAAQTWLEEARATLQPGSATDVEVAIVLEPGEDLRSRMQTALASTDRADGLAERGVQHPNPERFRFGDLMVGVKPSAHPPSEGRRLALTSETFSTVVAGFPVTPLVQLVSSMPGAEADAGRGERVLELLKNLMKEAIFLTSRGAMPFLHRTALRVQRRFDVAGSGDLQRRQQPEEAGTAHPTGHGVSNRKRPGPQGVDGPPAARRRGEDGPMADSPVRAGTGYITPPRDARLTEVEREHLRQVSGFERLPELADFLAKWLGPRWAVTGSVAVRLHAARLGRSDSPLNRPATDVNVACLDMGVWGFFPLALRNDRPDVTLRYVSQTSDAPWSFDFVPGMKVGVMPPRPARSGAVEDPVTIGGIPVMPLSTLERFKLRAFDSAQEPGNEAFLAPIESDLGLIRELRRLDEAAAPQRQG